MEKPRTNQSVDENGTKQFNLPITKSVSQRQSSSRAGFDAIESLNRVVYYETIVWSNPQFHQNTNKVVHIGEITRQCCLAQNWFVNEQLCDCIDIQSSKNQMVLKKQQQDLVV